MRTRGLQPRLLYPARLSIKMEGQIRSFPDKRSPKEHTSLKPALQDMLKDLLIGKEERVRERGTQAQKMATNKYLSIIILNMKGLSAPIKRHKIAEWIRKHDPHLCCLQETHLRTKDLHRLKVKGLKKYSMQTDRGKKKLG